MNQEKRTEGESGGGEVDPGESGEEGGSQVNEEKRGRIKELSLFNLHLILQAGCICGKVLRYSKQPCGQKTPVKSIIL